MLVQFKAIAELLRHFYAVITHSGVNNNSKVEKIQKKLEERLSLLTEKKRALQSDRLSGGRCLDTSIYLY
jgi:excinuclease UvrABC helicase subunit UvrB